MNSEKAKQGQLFPAIETVPVKTDIQDIFKYQLKIDSKVVSIETLFMNARRADRTDYKPVYQRNYVWDDDKATYFIESILLGTEIPPIVFFVSGDKTEVIDGRQRYETIKRFMDKDFKLKSKGLLKLKGLKNKNFDDLKEVKDIFWDTKLRLIEFSFRDQTSATPEKEEIVKKEIFKRYNSGITPLKSLEIDKAKYEDSLLNYFLKSKFLKNSKFKKEFSDVFFFEYTDDVELLLRKIRQQLVVPYIPINYYSNSKSEIIERFFNFLSDSANATDSIEEVYGAISSKISVLQKLKKSISEKEIPVNRVVMECLFWALQILEKEKIDYTFFFKKKTNVDKVVTFIGENISSYPMDDSNFTKQITERYYKTAELFGSLVGIDFGIYLTNNASFKIKNKELSEVIKDNDALGNFKSLRLSKPDASSNTIDDICMRMMKGRFLIRPTYQRQEVIDGIKSSAIIESILLGIKLPPIFVYKREDGVEEVLDGQQRLLSILGYLGKGFTDEKGALEYSKKNNFTLKKLNILDELNGKKFSQLPTSYQDRILDFDLWVIEISAENNKDFDPIDLFLRLNYKPYPILENTFEMWNSYIDRDIINKIKDIHSKNKEWFYLRKDNKRMETETLTTFLAFLEYSSPNPNANRTLPSILDIYRSGGKTNIRMKSKRDITQALEKLSEKQKFLESCEQLEDSFIKKLKHLLASNGSDGDIELKSSFDELMNVSKAKTRSYQNFYALWFSLLNIPLNIILERQNEVRSDITRVIKDMKTTRDVTQFRLSVAEVSNKYTA